MHCSHQNIDARSCKILQVGLPFISAALVYTALFTSEAVSANDYIAARLASDMLSHCMMALTLLVGGALLLDTAIKKDKSK